MWRGVVMCGLISVSADEGLVHIATLLFIWHTTPTPTQHTHHTYSQLPVSPQHATLPPPPPPPTGANPRLSRKLCMENLLAPCGVTSFCPDKAAEIFVQGREEIHVMVSGEGVMVGGDGVVVSGEGWW